MNYQDVFHVGVRVPDLDIAMAELGDGLGVTWAEPQRLPVGVWTPSNGFDQVDLRYTYSVEGPQHIELLQGTLGSLWDGDDLDGAHHMGPWCDDMGLWCDDVTAETDRLLASGWSLVASSVDQSDGADAGHGMFSDVQPPAGLIIELVDRSLRSFMEQWWSTPT